MACRRSLSIKTLFYRKWNQTSLARFAHHRSESEEGFYSRDSSQPSCEVNSFVLLHSRNGITNRVDGRNGTLFGRRNYVSAFRFAPGIGPSVCRCMSSSMGENDDNVGHLGDISEILTDKIVDAVSSQVSAMNEVAIAAADSAFPVAALEYLIGAVHSFTGLNWWAAIAITTILIQGATLTFYIAQMKATYSMNMSSLKLKEKIQDMQELGLDSTDLFEIRKELNELIRLYGSRAFLPSQGLIIQGPIIISFYFAISNMVEKVPSFKTGGALWFTDLTTPDSLCIFPILASLTFLVKGEILGDLLEYSVSILKNFSRVVAVLAVPFAMGFPKAFFCWWITSLLFSLSFRLAIREVDLRHLLVLPEAAIPYNGAQYPQPLSSEQSAKLKGEEGIRKKTAEVRLMMKEMKENLLGLNEGRKNKKS